MTTTRFKILLATALVGAWCCVGFSEVRAQGNELPEAVVIIVDGNRVQQQSLVGQDILRQIETMRTKLQAEIDNEQNKLREEGEELQSQYSVLTPQQLVPRQREYGAKVQAFQRMVESKQEVVQRSLTLANNEIDRSMRPILREIMSRHSANFVFDKSQVALSATAMEVTDEVIEMLDKKLPTFTLDLSDLE